MRKNLFRQVLLVAAVVSSSAAYGQLAMTRTTLPGLYSPISVGSGATMSTAVGNDAFQDLIPIGFTFNYLGTNYTTIGVSTNGIAAFTGITGYASNGALYDTVGPATVLAPWWDDLNVITGTGSILYNLTGTPGSRVFTIQWTDVQTYVGATARLNFQVLLYEGSNMIEFRYGAKVAGTNDTLESASIGLKNATGGNGNYLDAATGSAFTGNGMMQSTKDWPTYRIRFMPGMPSPIPGGTYTVGNGGNYASLSEAVADLNHRGISGAVTLLLTDSMYDHTAVHGSNWFPILLGPVSGTSISHTLTIKSQVGNRARIQSPGSLGGTCWNQRSPAAILNTNEPVFAVVGVQYLTLQDIDFTVDPTTQITDRGLLVINSSETVGTQHCMFKGLHVTLWRGNLATVGIEQRTIVVPLTASGANSYNTYLDFRITNTFSGMRLLGSEAMPDIGTLIATTSNAVSNYIGSTTQYDIGNAWNTTFGLRTRYEEDLTIRNTVIRNMASWFGGSVIGLDVLDAMGTTNIYNNQVYNLTNRDTLLTSTVVGMKLGVADTGSHTIRAYNNVVSGLGSNYAGPNSAIRQLKGIWVQPDSNGNSSSTINVDFNSVLLNGGASSHISNCCFEIATHTGPVINVRNNIFANATGAHTAPSCHYCWVSSGANAVGNTGSVSNNNVMFVGNATQGFTGGGGTSNYATLSNWQAAMLQDANTLDVDPQFTSSADLHVTNYGLNAMATPLPWVSDDMDFEARASYPDIGADEFDPRVDVGAVMLVAPQTGGCYNASQPVVVRIANYSNAPHNFLVDPVQLTVNVTGAATQTMSLMINSNALNGGNPLAVSGTLDVLVGTLNMTAAGNYNFTAWTATGADTISSNDTVSAMIQYHAGVASVSDPTVCYGDPVVLSVTGNTSNTIQWQHSTDGGNTWVNENGPGNTSSPYTAMPASSGTYMYRSMMCSSHASSSVAVAVDTLPIASFSINISGNTVTFTNTSVNAISFTWNFGDNTTISTQTNPVHTYTISGSFTVTLTATNNCGTDTLVFVIFTTGTNDPLAAGGVSVYPNPATDQFTVTLGAAQDNVVAELTDVQGKVLAHREMEHVPAGDSFAMDVRGYEQGVYFLRLTTADGVKVVRVVVQE